MKLFKWKYNFEQEGNDPKTVFEDFFLGCVMSRFEKGVNLGQQRLSYKILNKIKDSQDNSVSLEDAEFDFVKDVLTNAKYNPRAYKIAVEVDDAIKSAETVI